MGRFFVAPQFVATQTSQFSRLVEMKADVLVVGGGFAGLIAARNLASAGKSVVLLEGRDRLGGRALTVIENGVPVELGAEFVHGKPPVLLSLLEEARIPYFELEGKFYRVDHGRVAPDDYGDGEDSDSFAALKSLPASPENDLSFQEAAELSSMPPDQRRWMTRYVEGFNAADATRISAASLALQQQAEDAIDGDTSFRLTHGYKSLVAWLEAECLRLGVQIHVETPVRSVLWRRGEVVAACDTGEFHAERCIVTLPLGVLKAGTVQFQPEPEAIFAALHGLEMGDAVRISLVFRNRFWQNVAPEMSFLINGEGGEGDDDLTAWWTPNPSPAPLLTGWAGGTRARSLASGEELLGSALRSLARYFQTTEPALREQLVSWHTHDWHADQFSRGAYSYITTGGLGLLPALTRPVQDTLFFAGEHTEQDGHWGTVHAALQSGTRAARQIIESA